MRFTEQYVTRTSALNIRCPLIMTLTATRTSMLCIVSNVAYWEHYNEAVLPH